MNPTLQGYTAAVAQAAGSAALGDIAGDLEAIEQLVLSNAQLRAALSDTSVAGQARRAVMLDLLEGKVSGGARRVAAFACGVVPAQAVVAALSWLANRMRHLSEGLDDEPGLSLTQSRERVAGFATALYEDMPTNDLESLEDDLFRFARIVAATPSLRSVLTDRDRPLEVRQGLVTGLLEGKVPTSTLALVFYAVAGGRGARLRGDARFLGGADGAGQGLAHRSGAGGGADRRDPAEATHGLPGHTRRRSRRIAGGGRRVALEWRADPHRRPTGGRDPRGRLDALREHFAPADWEPSSGFGRRGHRSTDETEGAQ